MKEMHRVEIPPTLDWVVAGRERKTRYSTCLTCGEVFKHGRSWEGPCPACVAQAMDRENAAGFTVARQLALSAFTMFRHAGDPAIHCRWVCQSCGHESRSILRDMRNMTTWKAACPICVRGPQYAALAQSRYKNLTRQAQRIADILELKILKTTLGKNFPEPRNVIVHFTCKACGEQRSRSVSELRQGRSCPCSMSCSKGETIIATYLKLRGIPFVREFNLSRFGLPTNLRFDFYVESARLAIEYDGQQHYEPIPYFGGLDGFKIRQANDRRKNDLAIQAGVRILRVPFYCKSVNGFLEANLKI